MIGSILHRAALVRCSTSVSVLDLTVSPLGVEPPDRPATSGDRMIPMCFSLNDVNCRPVGRSSSRWLLDDQTVIFQSVLRRWWVEEDLNLRPHAYQACALTT